MTRAPGILLLAALLACGVKSPPRPPLQPREIPAGGGPAAPPSSSGTAAPSAPDEPRAPPPGGGAK